MIRPRLKPLIWPVVAAVLGTACTSSRAPVDAAGDSVSAATTMIGTLEAKLSVASSANSGSSVRISVDLVNQGDKAATLHSPADFPFDVIVRHGSNDIIWRQPPANSFRPLVAQLNPPIAPGHSGFYGAVEWDQRTSDGRAAPRGEYQISVLLRPGPPWGEIPIGPVNVRLEP